MPALVPETQTSKPVLANENRLRTTGPRYSTTQKSVTHAADAARHLSRGQANNAADVEKKSATNQNDRLQASRQTDACARPSSPIW